MRPLGIHNHKAFLFIAAFLISSLLTGCGSFHANLQETIDVKADGSGTVGVAVGMTQELEALLSNQGANLTQELSNGLNQSEGNTDNSNIKVTQWVDGDYSWVKAEKEFKSLDELNSLMQSNKMFQHFIVTRTIGIFQDEFTLDAELIPLSTVQNPTNGSSLVDPSSFIQFQLAVTLPGKVTQTNGVVNANDPVQMVWNIQSNEPVSINEVSETWDWLNIAVIGGASGIILLFALGFAITMFVSSRRYPTRPNKINSQKLPGSSSTLNLQVDILEGLRIEDLLRQVNTGVLHDSGKIYKKPNEMMLMWMDSNNQQRFIHIEATGVGTILVDGQSFPATQENAKSGILAAMKKHEVV